MNLLLCWGKPYRSKPHDLHVANARVAERLRRPVYAGQALLQERAGNNSLDRVFQI